MTQHTHTSLFPITSVSSPPFSEIKEVNKIEGILPLNSSFGLYLKVKPTVFNKDKVF